mmetsp:Transcript_29939/g.89027  ORF Transcript_29939/g.89027 Transcript_29939/m.89027 type:complete len:311 (+) Transcript_29939:424-1356(+)
MCPSVTSLFEPPRPQPLHYCPYGAPILHLQILNRFEPPMQITAFKALHSHPPPALFLIDPAHAVPAAGSRGRDHSHDVGGAGSTERNPRRDHQKIVGIRHQPLLEGRAASVPQDHVEIVAGLLHPDGHGAVVVEHILLPHVAVAPRVGQFRIDAPAQRQLPRRLLERGNGQHGHTGSRLGGSQYRRSAEGEAHDTLGLDGTRDLTGRDDDGVGGCLVGDGIVLMEHGVVVRIGFDSVDDALLHRYGFLGVLSRSTLGAQHDGVGAVVNGRRDVARLGPRGGRTLDHALEHLRRHDDGLSALPARIDDLLL